MTRFKSNGIARVAVLVLACLIGPPSHAQVNPHGGTVVGTWHLVRIESPAADGKPSTAPQPTGILIYTADGHAAVQLMYTQAAISNEFVHDGYEATFGTYDLDKGKQQLSYHVAGSATREKLVGQTETLHYEFPDSRHIIIRPTQPDQHWSVVWERY